MFIFLGEKKQKGSFLLKHGVYTVIHCLTGEIEHTKISRYGATVPYRFDVDFGLRPNSAAELSLPAAF